MRAMRFIRTSAVLLLALLVALLSSCVRDVPPAPASSGESKGTLSADKPSEGTPSEESTGETSLPAPEAIVLLYTDYLTVHAEQGGMEYEYTYCFDTEQRVFNAVAVIRFPTEADARKEYVRLLEQGYPNLQLEGTSLSFCFPRRECPFYGISYRSLELLIEEETVYEIVDSHPPEESKPDESAENM